MSEQFGYARVVDAAFDVDGALTITAAAGHCAHCLGDVEYTEAGFLCRNPQCFLYAPKEKNMTDHPDDLHRDPTSSQRAVDLDLAAELVGESHPSLANRLRAYAPPLVDAPPPLPRATDIIARSTAAAIENGGLREREHALAMMLPHDGYERALVSMLAGWAEYADAFFAAEGDVIGTDVPIGSSWSTLGTALHDLIDQERGRLDRDTLSQLMHQIAAANDGELDA
jgi:hypothetical protein